MKTKIVKKYRYNWKRINDVVVALLLIGIGIFSITISGDGTAFMFVAPMGLILLFDRKGA